MSRVITELADDIADLEPNPVKAMELGRGCYAVDALITLKDMQGEAVARTQSEWH